MLSNTRVVSLKGSVKGAGHLYERLSVPPVSHMNQTDLLSEC